MLTPKHGEPQVCERIRIKRDEEGNVIETEWYELVEDPQTLPPAQRVTR
jgi:hypothetical protein